MQIKNLVVLSAIASTSAFAPAAKVQSTTALNGLFERIADMDLFAPNPDVNTYGARNKKTLVQGKITEKSYVPNGLTAEQYAKIRSGDAQKKADNYAKIRSGDAQKKADNYAKNVKKAGVFEDYTEFYLKRGTDTGETWAKSVTKGHRMAKTKYDWSGSQDNPKQAGLAAVEKPKKKY